MAEPAQGSAPKASSKQSSKESSKQETPKTNAWSGNKAHEFNTKSIRERTFRVRLPTQFSAKDVLASVSGILLKTEVETVSKQSTPGHWTIVTTSAEGADKLITQNTLTIGPEKERYRLEPRVQRATLLIIPLADPEISNTEIFDYFSQYGYISKVTHEFYKENGFTHVKTGQRLVFIRLAEGSSPPPPPFCIIRNQVSLRGKTGICYHCNVEGHGKGQCLIRELKTCYNCGSIVHSHSQCFAPTLVAYYFDPTTNYPQYCYPRGFKPHRGQEFGEDVNADDFGNIRNKEEAWDYNLTFEPKFYMEQARQTFFEEMCAERQREKEEEPRRQAEAEMDPPHVAL